MTEISEAQYNNYQKVKQQCEAHQNFKYLLFTHEEIMEFLFGKTQVIM